MPKVVPEYKEEAKSRILDAAAKVFAEKGYHQATMDDVARSIGVSKGAIYLYFKNKEELFEELCRAGLKVFEKTLYSSLTGADLLKTASLYFDKEMEQPAAGRLLWLESLAETPRSKAIKKALEDSYARYRQVVVKFLEEARAKGSLGQDADVRSLAGFLIALHDGLLVDMAQGLTEAEAKKVWNEGIGFFFEGTTKAQSQRARS